MPDALAYVSMSCGRTVARMNLDDSKNRLDNDVVAPFRPRTIAVFIAHLDPGTFTNLGITLVKGFIAKGVDAELVVVRATREQAESVQDIPLHVLGGSRTLFSAVPLIRYLRTHRPDILLSMSTYPNIAALIAATFARVAESGVVVTEHNLMSREMEQHPSRLLFRQTIKKLISFLYPKSVGLVAVSRDVLEDRVLNGLYDVKSRPHAAIHNPIPSNNRETGSESLHPWLAPDRETPTLVAVGALVTAKGFDDLIDAVALLRNSGFPLRLVILGEGKLRSSLEQLVSSLGLDDCVCMPGFVRDPWPYLNECDAFVLSSRWEGNPLVMLEAMSCGSPIVATACVSGVTDVLQHRNNGLLVPVGDPAAMAEALREILGDCQLAERLGAEAKSTSTQFHPLIVVQKYIAFFEYCRGGKPVHPSE